MNLGCGACIRDCVWSVPRTRNVSYYWRGPLRVIRRYFGSPKQSEQRRLVNGHDPLDPPQFR